MKAVIHKTVHVPDEKAAVDCPFCAAHTFRVGRNAQGKWFYKCFGCNAGGSICLALRDDETQTAPIATNDLS